METVLQPRKLGGPGMLAFTLLFVAPSVLAFFTSYALVHRTFYFVSALWFVYEVSFYLGAAGAALAFAMMVVCVARRKIPLAFLWLMGIAAVAAVLFEWYASHIYRNPWSS